MKKALIVLFVLTLALAFFAGYSPAKASKDKIKLKVFVHYPSPQRPVVEPTCTVSEGTIPNHYLAAGWQMPTLGLTYKINFSSLPKNLTEAQVHPAINNSFAAWKVADPDQVFTDGGTTSARSLKLDGTNAILWKGISGNAIAVTWIWSQDGVVLETDTAFNKNLKWTVNSPSLGDCIDSATYDVQNIGTHEFGHWVGLDDLYNTADKDLTMYGYGDTGELKKDSLGLGDITGVNSIAP